MANIGLTKAYTAGGTINPFRIVKFGSNDYEVVQSAAVGDLLIGVSTEVDASTGERVDVVQAGIADVKIGGSVTRGQLLTSDASGQGVAAAPAAGTNNRVIGVALISGVSGDIIPVVILQGSIQG